MDLKFWKKSHHPRSENFRRNTPIIAKIPAKNPITKKPVTSKELRLHPCGPSLQGFHSKGSSPMPAVSGGEWHAAWIATFGKILVSTLSCGVVHVASTFSCEGPFGFKGYMVVYFGFNDLRTCPVTTTSGLNPVYRQNGRRNLPWAAGGPARFFIFSWT